MHKIFSMFILVAGFAMPAVGNALTLTQVTHHIQDSALPQRGASKAAVLQAFGTPAVQRAPVGGDRPQQPPITRWDYHGYSVFFERDTVIDVVVEHQPAPVHHVDELQPHP